MSKKDDLKKLIEKKFAESKSSEVLDAPKLEKKKTVVDKKEAPKKTAPKKAALKTESSEEEDVGYRIYWKKYENGLTSHAVYYNIPEDNKITKFTEKGTRVIVARYPGFYKIYFLEYLEIGQKDYPRGGIKVYNQTQDQVQSFYYESVAVHPTKKDKYKVLDLE